jgi:hypothetical protein
MVKRRAEFVPLAQEPVDEHVAITIGLSDSDGILSGQPGFDSLEFSSLASESQLMLRSRNVLCLNLPLPIVFLA